MRTTPTLALLAALAVAAPVVAETPITTPGHPSDGAMQAPGAMPWLEGKPQELHDRMSSESMDAARGAMDRRIDRGPGGDARMAKMLDGVFDLMDHDEDGALSREEFRKGVAMVHASAMMHTKMRDGHGDKGPKMGADGKKDGWKPRQEDDRAKDPSMGTPGFDAQDGASDRGFDGQDAVEESEDRPDRGKEWRKNRAGGDRTDGDRTDGDRVHEDRMDDDTPAAWQAAPARP